MEQALRHHDPESKLLDYAWVYLATTRRHGYLCLASVFATMTKSVTLMDTYRYRSGKPRVSQFSHSYVTVESELW